MTYVIGIIGFVFGFAAGQMALMVMLRQRSNREILKDKSIHWSYGLFNWLVAGLGAWLAVSLYALYIG